MIVSNELGGFDSRSAKPSGPAVTGGKVFGTGKRTEGGNAKSTAKLGTLFFALN